MKTVIALLVFLNVTGTDSEWRLRKDNDGIAIYTRTVEGSAIAEFRGEVTIDQVTLQHVLDVITDVKSFDSLFPDCTDARILKQDGKYNSIHYLVTITPFPVADRDGIYELKTEISADGRSAKVVVNVLPDYLPYEKDYVRITRGSGFWRLEQSLNSVTVTYQFHGEPGGNVPAWLTNSFIIDHPFKTLENLKNRLR
jgi:hypothetical protein